MYWVDSYFPGPCTKGENLPMSSSLTVLHTCLCPAFIYVSPMCSSVPWDCSFGRLFIKVLQLSFQICTELTAILSWCIFYIDYTLIGSPSTLSCQELKGHPLHHQRRNKVNWKPVAFLVRRNSRCKASHKHHTQRQGKCREVQLRPAGIYRSQWNYKPWECIIAILMTPDYGMVPICELWRVHTQRESHCRNSRNLAKAPWQRV